MNRILKSSAVILLSILLSGVAWAGIDLNGDADYIDCGSGASVDNVIPFTVCAWVYIHSLTSENWNSILTKYVSTGSVLLEISNFAGNPNTFATFWDCTGQDMYGAAADNTLTTNTWYFLVASWAGLGNNPKLYMGTLTTNLAEVTYDLRTAGSTATNSDAGNSLAIGRINTSTPGRYFNGLISEVYLWNAVLTLAELQEIFNSRIKGMGLQIQPASLKGYWALDDQPLATGINTKTFQDQSGNANTGTATDADGDSLIIGESVLSYPLRPIGD
jgi:hypothetical protein